MILPDENNFTARLGIIALKPKMLYYYGKIPENDQRFLEFGPRYKFEQAGRPRSVAVVGARKNTEYGKEQAYKIAYNLAKAGVVVISGLAYGIDSIAHRATLDAKGITVAVLGTPIDQIYPASHLGLAKEIISSGGAVISEYDRWSEIKKDEKMSKFFQSSSGRKAAFLHRNRLISGLADIVIIVEADLRSGSLNTAHHAFEQSNLVYAVPGDVTRASSRGCNRLLGRGAVAMTDLMEVLMDLGINEKMQQRVERQVLQGENEDENRILQQLRSGISDGESIMQKINQAETEGMDVPRFAAAMFGLQMSGRVKSMGGNKWLLVD